MIEAALGAIVALACVGAYLSPHALRVARVRRLARWCAANRALALTYDDGPSQELTARVLDVLSERGVKATFFLLGGRAEAAPHVADLLKDEGHELGCHSHEHLHAWKTWPWRARRDVARGFEALARWVGAGGMFRPPYGKMTLLTSCEAWMRGARVGWWTVDSGDTWDPMANAGDAIERVRRAGGGVALLHDFDRDTPDAEERATFVLDVTRGLLDLAEREGWRVLTLGEVMEGAGLR